jgi:hypothetical protein
MSARDEGTKLAGRLLAQSLISGWLAIAGAVFSAYEKEWSASALFLIAAGVSFGLLANAVLRE